MSEHSPTRTKRLKLTKAFRAVYRSGRWAHSRVLSVGIRANDGDCSRLGLRTQRGLKGGVVRNSLMRRVRAIYAAHQSELSAGHDIVVVIRQREQPPSQKELKEELLKLWKRLKLL